MTEKKGLRPEKTALLRPLHPDTCVKCNEGLMKMSSNSCWAAVMSSWKLECSTLRPVKERLLPIISKCVVHPCLKSEGLACISRHTQAVDVVDKAGGMMAQRTGRKEKTSIWFTYGTKEGWQFVHTKETTNTKLSAVQETDEWMNEWREGKECLPIWKHANWLKS